MHRRQSREVGALDTLTSSCRGWEILIAAFPFSMEAVGRTDAYIARLNVSNSS